MCARRSTAPSVRERGVASYFKDGGDAGSIGGIPDGEDFHDEWGEHEISELHHSIAFAVALILCLLFSAWVASAFFTIKTEAGWANLPRVVLTDNARKLMNSVDKEFKK